MACSRIRCLRNSCLTVSDSHVIIYNSLGNNSSVDAFVSVMNVSYFVLLVKSFLCIRISLVLFVRKVLIEFTDHDTVSYF